MVSDELKDITLDEQREEIELLAEYEAMKIDEIEIMNSEKN